MPKTVTVCPESPALGAHSKFCESHKQLERKETKQARIVVKINCKDLTVSSKVLPMTENLPANNDLSVHIACKKATQVTHYYHRTAGVMALVRPCGMIIHFSELFTCESPTQLFIQLLRLKCDAMINMRYFGYDRACEFEPYLSNLKKKGNEGAKLLLENTLFLVDNFHIKGHTTPACNIESEECKYHPKLSKFNEIHGVNTECAEQAFA